MRVLPALRGRKVLVAHEDALRAGYLRDAVEAAGAEVPELVHAAPRALEALAGPGRLDAMLMSTMLAGGAVTVVAAAAERGLRIAVVSPTGAHPGSPFRDYRCVAAPFGAYQVADALAEVLAAARGCVHWSAAGEAFRYDD